MTVRTFPAILVPGGGVVCADCGTVLGAPALVTVPIAPTAVKPPLGYALPATTNYGKVVTA